MKKLLGILVLGLLLSSNAFAEKNINIIIKNFYLIQLKKGNEKTFRDRGFGFKDYCPIDYGTTRARPEHREINS